MPKAVRAALALAWLSLALLLACEVALRVLFIRGFLVHAEGLGHKSAVLAGPVAEIVQTFVYALFIALLVLAVGRGKSWARRSYVVIASLTVIVYMAVAAAKLALPHVPLYAVNVWWWKWVNAAAGLLIVPLLFFPPARAWFAADRTQENIWRNRLACMAWWCLYLLASAVAALTAATANAISEKACEGHPRLRKAQLLARAAIGSNGGSAAHDRLADREKFDAMMREWTENARTNTAIETAASFRDDVLVPFARREMPNPFAPGGEESGRPWAEEAFKTYEAGLRFICDDRLWLGMPDERICSRANSLVKQGCEEPFVLLWSAFADEMDWCRTTKHSAPRLDKALKIAKSRKGSELLQLVIYFYRWLARIDSGDANTKRSIRSWLSSKAFAPEDEVAVYSICSGFGSYAGYGWFEGFDNLKWAAALDAAKQAIDEGFDSSSRGVASAITRRGWRALAEKNNAAWAMLGEAESRRPGRVETLRYALSAEGASRRGRRERFDGMFKDAENLRLDDAGLLGIYHWYRLYPRWGKTKGYDEMLRFADACYETGRHDTMLPYFYAEMQCRYVRDSNTDPYKYFKSRPDITEKCIDVCLRQATNELACGYARTHAPIVGAAVAYYAGRYEDAGLLASNITCSTYTYDRYNFNEMFPNVCEIYDRVQSFCEANSNICIRLQRMVDDGRYEEARAEIGELKKSKVFRNTDFPTHCYWDYRLAECLLLDIAMKTDFVAGKPVAAMIPSFLHGWEGCGWWRCSDRTIQSYGALSWDHCMTWMAKLPKAHQMELELEPKPNTGGRHVLVVSRYVHEESHYRPINGIPFVTLIWEKDRTGAYLSCDYYRILKIDESAAYWSEASDPKRKIRIVCDGRSVSVYVGGSAEPLCSSSEFAHALTRSPESGKASFRGDNIRISNITVLGCPMRRQGDE